MSNTKKRWAFIATGVVFIAIVVVVVMSLSHGGGAQQRPGGFDNYYYQEDYERIPRITPSEFPRRQEPLRLSDFIEDLQVVHFDSNNPEALLGTYVAPTLSENYIGIKTSEPNLPFRLFDRKSGKFIRKIGSVGRGPGEYTGLYDWMIDEANDRVYLVPFADSRILEYTLSGKYIGEIAAVAGGKKTKIEVRDTILTAFTLPFPEDSMSVYTYTRSGRLLSTAPNPFGGARSFDNELYVNKTGSATTGYQVSNVPIYYRYDHAASIMEAVFGIDKVNDKERWMGEVHESPLRYLIKIFHFASENGENRPKDYWLSIDKQTDERSAGFLVNDFLGSIETTNSTWPDKYYNDHSFAFENGWYMETISAIALKRLLKDVLAENEMSQEVRTRVEALYSSFEEDDNHFLFYGKLKDK